MINTVMIFIKFMINKFMINKVMIFIKFMIDKNMIDKNMIEGIYLGNEIKWKKIYEKGIMLMLWKRDNAMKMDNFMRLKDV